MNVRTLVDEQFQVQERVPAGYWVVRATAEEVEGAADWAAQHIAKRTDFCPVRIVKVVVTTTTTTEVIPL